MPAGSHGGAEGQAGSLVHDREPRGERGNLFDRELKLEAGQGLDIMTR